MYRSRVKWNNPGNGVSPFQHLGVVAIEKGAFKSPSTKVANLIINKIVSILSENTNKIKRYTPLYTYIYIYVFELAYAYIYIYIYIYIYMGGC